MWMTVAFASRPGFAVRFATFNDPAAPTPLSSGAVASYKMSAKAVIANTRGKPPSRMRYAMH